MFWKRTSQLFTGYLFEWLISHLGNNVGTDGMAFSVLIKKHLMNLVAILVILILIPWLKLYLPGFYKVTILSSITGAPTPGLILAPDLLGNDRSFICSSLVVQDLPVIQERDQVPSLGWIRKLPWRRKWQPIPVFLSGEFHVEEPGRLQSMGLQRVGHSWAG